MLGPFRVRNLRRPTTPPNRAHYKSATRRGSSEAVVSITGPEYDYNILMHPESKLKYLDEDDGEVVTAGTSFELAQRLDDPVPTFTKSRHNAERPIVGYDAAAPLRTASPDMHVFEIDRQGDSVRIWEEIEQRTMQLQLSQVPMHPEVSPGPVKPPTSEKITASRSPTIQNARSKLHWPPAPSERTSHPKPGSEDDMSVQVDDSDDICRLQELRETHESSYEGHLVTNKSHSPAERARLQVFLSTNPPKLSATSSEENIQSTRHTSMKLSDVLNDDAGSQYGPGETAPLLASFYEGSLTAEGKRQAMEAGNRLRARANPIYYFNPRQNRVEDVNRWASYGNVKYASVDLEQSSTTIERVSPLPATPTEEDRVGKESEGSLLQAFRAELAKISRPLPVESNGISEPAVEVRSDADNEDVMAETLPPPPTPNLEVLTSKLILQAISSIGSTVGTLQSQLRHHILDALPMSPNGKDVPNDSLKRFVEVELRRACDEFENSTEMSLISLRPESFVDETGENCNQALESSMTVAGVECLQSLACAFQEMSRRLRIIEDFKNGIHIQRSPSPQVTIVIDPIPLWAQNQDVTGFIRQYARHDMEIMEFVQSATVIQPSNSRLPIAICRINGYKEATRLCTILNGQLWENNKLNAESTLSSPLYPDIGGRQLVGLHKAPLPHHIRGSFGQDGHWHSACVPHPSLAINNRVSVDIYSACPAVRSNILSPSPETNAVESTRQEDHNQTSKIQCVRFEDQPVTSKNTRTDGGRISNPIGRAESIIYRHVPSDMPWESADHSRGRASLKPSPSSSGPLHKYVDVPTERNQRFKRRFTPQQEGRRESRSRSRSPVLSDGMGGLDLRGNSLPRRYQRPQSFHQSSLPVRQYRELESSIPKFQRTRGIMRSHGSTSALNCDYKTSDHQVLNQGPSVLSSAPVRSGRFTDKAPASYVSTLRHFGHIYDRSRVSGDGQTPLRHSKSLNAIRRPPQLKVHPFRNNKQPEWSAGIPGTVKEPLDDYVNESAELVTDFDLGTKPSIPNVAPPNSPLVITRFPTLEQFESGNRTDAPQFPPLPSMEPLIPLRPNAPRTDDVDENTLHSTNVFAKANDSTSPKMYESGWSPRTVRLEESESSGDFFRRMTGLNDSPRIAGSPVLPVRLGPAAPGARLVKPFDPLAETATIHRHQLIDGIRRSATIGGLHDRYATNRRPYSAYFDGNGRVEWDAFIQGHRNPETTAVNPADDCRLQSAHMSPTEQPHSTQDFDETIAPMHQDPATVQSVQQCVDQLVDLGFGKEVNGGQRRLVVYAQAAEGKLEEAIDMIDDERRAYEEMGPLENRKPINAGQSQSWGEV